METQEEFDAWMAAAKNQNILLHFRIKIRLFKKQRLIQRKHCCTDCCCNRRSIKMS